MLRIAVAFLVVATISTPLAAAPSTEALSAEDRAMLVDLPRMYRAAKDDESRKTVVEEAKRLGEKGVARVRPLVGKQIEAALKRYHTAFVAAAGKLVENEDELTAKAVREKEAVAESRAELLALGELADLLELAFPPAIAPASSSDEPRSFAETLDALEEQGIAQLRTLVSLQSLDETEQAIFKLLNAERAKQGVPPMVIDPQLCVAAKVHSHDMVQHKFFSHTSPLSGKESFGDRANLAGTSASAENIAVGAGAEKVVSMWMNSEGHRANILNARNRRIGIGRSERHFTTVFGN